MFLFILCAVGINYNSQYIMCRGKNKGIPLKNVFFHYFCSLKLYNELGLHFLLRFSVGPSL